ncbi:S9 family peptidase [Actinacidiphila sp. bgisy145]|uniref:S9 family peptidase n=1 Tax=Actinacidiphila sp. bgisy145 TaxID=3413792 RepID=UPI003EB86338
MTAAPPLRAELLVDGAVPHSPAVSPDGRLVAYCVEAFDADGGRTSRLWVGPSDGSAPPAPVVAGFTACERPCWGPDSASLVFRSGGQLHQVPVNGTAVGAPRPLTDRPGGIVDHWPSADGATVAVSALDEPGGAGEDSAGDPILWGRGPSARLRLLDLGTRTLRTVDGLGDRHVVDVSQRPDGGPLAVVSWAQPETDPGVFTAELHLVDPGSGAVRGLGPVAALVSTAPHPMDVFAGAARRPLTRLTDTRPELRRIAWGTQERLSYRAGDGLGLDGLLILPPGRTRGDGPFPLVAFVHGGPYHRWADELTSGWFDPGQWLAAAGLAVFLPNPRGGQGHGHAFAAAVAGRLGAEEFTDILAGIDLLVEAGIADPGRLGIGGWSHGGFMAAWAVGQTDRFGAAMMGAGISDWGMQAAIGEEGALEGALGGSRGWEGPGPHRHDAHSPISFAARVRTPVLILHGQDDTNVPLGQSLSFHRALRHFGVPHEFAVYPREGHGLTERAHQLDALHRVRTWFTHHLAAPAPHTS